jgi:folylpolyglutamate synthase/dihydropteroate synthase
MLREVFPVPVESIPSPVEAIRLAMSLREGSQAIVVFGSIYLIQPARDGWDQYREENNLEITAAPGQLKAIKKNGH